MAEHNRRLTHASPSESHRPADWFEDAQKELVNSGFSALFDSERRQRTHMDIIELSTEVLGDLDNPYSLRSIADALRAVVKWAGFYRSDRGLRHVEGVEIAGERSHAKVRLGVPGFDPIRDILDGRLPTPASFRLDEQYDAGSASDFLARDISKRVEDATGMKPVSCVLIGIKGRRDHLGLLAVWTDAGPTGIWRDAGSKIPHWVTRTSASAGRDLQVLLEVIARRAGIAFDNARLYAREHELAQALQHAALPESAEIDGLDIWTHYAPSAEHAKVGGDWYDVMAIDSRTTALTIGDVVGADAEAAAVMGQLRSVVRAYAAELSMPGVVLERVDRLVAGMDLSRTASLVYGTLRRSGFDDTGLERWTLRYSRAGHFAPMLLRSGKVHLLDGASGTLVGYGNGDRKFAQVELRPADTLLLFTDGLVERRDRSIIEGLRQLQEVFAEVAATSAAAIGEELLARLADAPEDDIALVVVRIPSEVGDEVQVDNPHAYKWTLPRSLTAAQMARRGIKEAFTEWGIDDITSAQLAVSELVTNAARYGWGDEIVVRLFDTGATVLIEVEDKNPAPPLAMEGHPGRSGGFGISILDRIGEWGWRPNGSGKIVWARLHPSSEALNPPEKQGN
jgi:hypothetical protein